MNQKTYQQEFRLSRDFCRIQSVNELSRLLQEDKRRLTLSAEHVRYKSFSIPKKGGGERHIETPSPALKRIQSKLNRYLQSVYYFEKSHAAFGFIIGVRNDDDRRNVLSNARKHLNKPYLLNMDLKDFFHSVKRKRVLEIFNGEPFNFKNDLPGVLTQLTTYKGKLPMGAPTSPALSNLACRELDERLIHYAQAQEWVYTRYADDMSFSAMRDFRDEQVNEVRTMIREAQFDVNEKKVIRYGPDDEKVVTGLLLRDKATLTDDYLQLLERDIAQLRSVMEVQNFQGEISSRWVDQFKLQARGRLNFAGFVLGKRHPAYLHLKDAYYEAINPPKEDFGAVSWRSFPYNI